MASKAKGLDAYDITKAEARLAAKIAGNAVTSKTKGHGARPLSRQQFVKLTNARQSLEVQRSRRMHERMKRRQRNDPNYKPGDDAKAGA